MTRCMRGAGFCAALMCAVAVASIAPAAGAQDATAPELTVAQIREDIGLLELLNRLGLEQTQMQQLLTIASDVQSRRDEMRKIEENEQARGTLLKIRQALIEGKQGEEVEQLHAPLAKLWEGLERKEQQFGDAMQNAVEQALTLLEDDQIDTIIRGEMGDPATRLAGALEEARHVPPAEFDGWLTSVSHDIALALVMGNQDACKQTEGQIQDLCKRVREMNNADFEAQAELLEQEAQGIAQAAEAEPNQQWREQRARQTLQELLMHPRLPDVLKAKLAFIKGA